MICDIIALSLRPVLQVRAPHVTMERMITDGTFCFRPLVNYYGNTPKSIDYPRKTMYQLLLDTARRYPQNIAYEFMGKSTDYTTFLRRIELTARAFVALGIHKGTG